MTNKIYIVFGPRQYEGSDENVIYEIFGTKEKAEQYIESLKPHWSYNHCVIEEFEVK